MKDATNSKIQYPFSYRDAVEILKLVQDTPHCVSMDLRIGDISLSLTRSGTAKTGTPARGIALTSPPVAQDVQCVEPPPVAEVATGVTGPAAQPGVVEIKTPTLGVFYRRPSPSAGPFVKEGDHVKADDQIGLLEVMKLYMPINAGVTGQIVEILAEDGALVEHEQVLMLVKID